MPVLFKKTHELESKLDEFFDAVSEACIIFEQAVSDYLQDQQDSFLARMDNIRKLEHHADYLRRDVEAKLYRNSLIPDQRGDVLSLLETMDHVVDSAKETVVQLDVEKPQIPVDFHQEFKDLAAASVFAAEASVRASRAFFRDVHAVTDHLHKVYFHEKEADRLADILKRKLFAKEGLHLSQKIHLRYFALHIEQLSDKAEEVAERLSIYAIKRTV
jgi:uncharacterized protein